MSQQLPVKTTSKQIGEVASTHMQLYFQKLGWNYRSQEDQNDFGIDGEVEIVDQNLVTATIFKCQIKGTERLVWNGEHVNVPVRRETFDYWCGFGVPVVALLVNNPTGEAFWSLPLAHHPVPGQASVPITFVQSNKLSPDGIALKAIATAWHRSFSPTDILAEVPIFHRIYEELKEWIDWGDMGTHHDPEINGRVRLFYRHVMQLRLSLGLDTSTVIPLDHFYIRNCGIWDEALVLCRETFSELMIYVSALYDEAIGILKKRLQDVKPCFEHRDVVKYFHLGPASSGPNIYVTYTHPRSHDPSFHRKIEAELDKVGALRYSWDKKKFFGPA